ncbi:MerR family transcriptional regulator [Pseudonocardia dioxanivorans]|nr:MerR family transcriptional regulator [Pseudonocardia dioxanivorans]
MTSAWPKHRERLVAAPAGTPMTIGELSARTGVPVKRLRRYDDLGFLYTVGRSAGNFRLYDESALWCVRAVETWRSLGLTLDEIGDLTEAYLTQPDEPIGPHLARQLQTVRHRTRARIAELTQLLDRIEEFETRNRAALAGEWDFRETDPRCHPRSHGHA